MTFPFGNAITGGGGQLVRDRIKSENYVPGVSGWTINKDGTAEFQDAVIRGELVIGVSPNPRIDGTAHIPAALVAAAAGYNLQAAILYYFSATDFYFDAVGINTGVNHPVLLRGALIGGTLLKYEEYDGGNAISGSFILYGSAGNPAGTTWVYRNGTMHITGNAEITVDPPNQVTNQFTGTLVPPMPMQSATLGTAGLVQLASNTTTELVFASAVYDGGNDYLGDFLDGHAFRVVINGAVANNAFATNSGEMRVRQGRATTTGTIIAQWTVGVPVNAASSFTLEAYFVNNTGADILNEFLSICWHRFSGAGIVSLQGNADTPMTMMVYDLGLAFSLGQQFPFARNMV